MSQQQQVVVQDQSLAKSKKKKDEWIWWAIGGAVVGTIALGVGVFIFGNKEPGPVNPPAIGAPDLPDISQNPFVSLGAYPSPTNEFQQIVSNQATKKPCGCSAKKR